MQGDDAHNAGLAYWNLAELARAANDAPRALRYARRALPIIHSSRGHSNELASLNAIIGEGLLAEQRIEDAREHYEAALERLQRAYEPRSDLLIQVHLGLAAAYEQLGLQAEWEGSLLAALRVSENGTLKAQERAELTRLVEL